MNNILEKQTSILELPFFDFRSYINYHIMNYVSQCISAGAVKTTSANIDYETIGTTTFLMTAYVSDGSASASGTLTISITNQNEAPQFQVSTYTLTGNEGSVR